jgi:DNA (cytosine-5)-methyltransferase 1
MCLNAGAMGRRDAETETLLPVGGFFDNEANVAVVKPVIGFYPTEGRDLKGFDNVCPTLKVGTNGPSGTPPGVAQSMSVRRLTPTECERLQGFPDRHTAISWKGKPASECPDGPRYKALGNSMACNVMRWIGRRIELVEQTC